jgi:hypothetical protein
MRLDLRRFHRKEHSHQPLKNASARLGTMAAMLTQGGTDGNERLTTVTGAILVALLLVIGVTILRIRQLISVHLFVGLLLIGPVALKLASTGYRFVRYYTGNPAYRLKGPPEWPLRLIAPIVVITTVTVFVSGVLLMFAGSHDRDPLLPIHKVSFIVWAVFTGLHLLGHLPRLLAARRRVSMPGGAGRTIAITGALVAGVVLAVVLIPQFSGWTAAG